MLLKKIVLKKSLFPPNKLNYENFTKNTSIATSSMMIRRKLFNKIKLSNSPNFEDYFLKCQILKKLITLIASKITYLTIE